MSYPEDEQFTIKGLLALAMICATVVILAITARGCEEKRFQSQVETAKAEAAAKMAVCEKEESK